MILNENQLAGQALVDEMRRICERYGYELYTAYNMQFSEGGKLYPTLKVYPIDSKSYSPEIYYEDDDVFGNKPRFSIQTTSYGSLDIDEYAKFIIDCRSAYQLVKDLEEIDLSLLPVRKKY